MAGAMSCYAAFLNRETLMSVRAGAMLKREEFLKRKAMIQWRDATLRSVASETVEAWGIPSSRDLYPWDARADTALPACEVSAASCHRLIVQMVRQCFSIDSLRFGGASSFDALPTGCNPTSGPVGHLAKSAQCTRKPGDFGQKIGSPWRTRL
jgi:hypothetical protein